MNAIKVRNLKKKFGKTTALDGVDLTVKAGDIYGFIGPNGAGKSTTIRILLGLLNVDEGNATILGQDPFKDPIALHKRIAYVPSDVKLWDHMTGGEVIDYLGRMRGRYSTKRRAELIDMFHLDPSIKCKAYSKGNRQKVILISAFVSDVELYILDEPTTGLDPLMETIFQQCIKDMREAGKTVFLSSHILSEVEALCNCFGLIRSGRIIKEGNMDEIKNPIASNEPPTLEGLFMNYYEGGGKE